MEVKESGHIKTVKKELVAVFEIIDIVDQLLSRSENRKKSLKKNVEALLTYLHQQDP